MLFEEKVVNLQLFNHKRQMSMISNSDFEKLWVLYKTEGEPQGVSINAFCISRGVNYNEFFDERSGKAERNKWFRKMHKSVVTLEMIRTRYQRNPLNGDAERIKEACNDEYTNGIVNRMHVKFLELIAKGEDYFPPAYTIRLYRPVSRSVATSGTSSWTMSGLGIKVEGTLIT